MAVDVSGDGGVLKQVIQEGNGQKVRIWTADLDG